MNYVLFICSDGRSTPEQIAAMQREVPGWVEEMDARGVRLLGRELRLPETAATVRVRRDETLVSDGPFTEAKEFIGGFDLLDCDNLDEAIEVAAKHATSWFHMIEVRPSRDDVRLGEKASAFARFDDSQGTPYMLIMWAGDRTAVEDGGVLVDSDAWREDAEKRGLYILGAMLESPSTATTVRVRDRETQLSDGPFIDTDEFIAGFEVVSCADQQQAVQLAAEHPLARDHAVEVRPFWTE